MKKLLVLSILLATATATSTATAESLEERKYWRGQMDYLQRSLDSAAKQCGAKFTFEWVNKPKFREEATKNNNSPYSICASAVDLVDSICREGEDEKTTVAAKIKGFKCGYAEKRTLELKGGIVTYMGNHTQSNFTDWARPALLKKL